MRILFISDVYFPRINGVSTSIQTFAHQLMAKGHEICLIAPQYPEDADDEFDIRRVPSRKVLFDPEDRLMKICALRKLSEYVKTFSPDVIHIQTPFAAHYHGLRHGRGLGVPVVESYHTYFEQYLENYLPLLPRHALRWLARRFSLSQCNQVDALVVPSRPMLDVLRSYGTRTRCHVLPTGIPSARFVSGQGAAFRVRHGIPAEQPLLLYVGRVAFEKNIGFLIDMVDKVRRGMPDVMLVIAGEGPAREALQRLVAARGLGANVRFVGYLSRNRDLPDCYAAADAFVFASKTETQGLVLLEAMASGVPVVTTAVMGTADIMADGMGGLVSDEDPELFANAVIRLLGDNRLRQRLVEEALRKADQWSDSALADRLVTVYEELIDMGRDPATAEYVASSRA